MAIVVISGSVVINMLYLTATSYHVSVKTGDKSGAGTDADVHLKIFGTKGDTGLLQLKNAENTLNKFEKGRTDLFKLEATDIGKVQLICHIQCSFKCACIYIN